MSNDGIYHHIPESKYHADRISLSHSGAKLLLEPGGPAKFRYAMDNETIDTDALRLGRLAHTVILGEGAELAVVDAKDWRTNMAKAAKEQASKDGKTACLVHEYQRAQRMRSAVLNHPDAAELLAQGDPEVSYYWTDPDSGHQLRARADWITNYRERTTIVDIKTTVNGHPEDFGRTSLHTYRYYMQHAWYVTGWQTLHPETVPAFLLVLVEKEPPHLISVVEPDAESFSQGIKSMWEAIARYQKCCKTGVWPGYPTGIRTVSLPPWTITGPSISELINDDAITDA